MGAVARLLEMLFGADQTGDEHVRNSTNLELARLAAEVRRLGREVNGQGTRYTGGVLEVRSGGSSGGRWAATLLIGVAGYYGARYCYGQGVKGIFERFAYVSRGAYKRGIEDIAEALASVYRSMHALRARVIDLHETTSETNEKVHEIETQICDIKETCDGLDRKIDFSNSGIHLLCRVVSHSLANGSGDRVSNEHVEQLIEFSNSIPPLGRATGSIGAANPAGPRESMAKTAIRSASSSPCVRRRTFQAGQGTSPSPSPSPSPRHSDSGAQDAAHIDTYVRQTLRESLGAGGGADGDAMRSPIEIGGGHRSRHFRPSPRSSRRRLELRGGSGRGADGGAGDESHFDWSDGDDFSDLDFDIPLSPSAHPSRLQHAGG